MFFCRLNPETNISRQRSQAGVEAIELAIVLPLFFGMLFGFIDVARIVSGYAAVRTAAATGARYAVGFQRTEWNSVQTLTGGADKIALNAGLLSSQIPDFVSDGSYGQWYVDRAAAQNLLNNELYKIELKGIAFATRILSRSVGKANYPCEQPGCFHCFTLRGDQNNYDQYFSIDTGGGSRTWTANMLGLTCTFNVPITTTMVAFGWLPITVPVTARVYVPVQNQAGAVYDPN